MTDLHSSRMEELFCKKSCCVHHPECNAPGTSNILQIKDFSHFSIIGPSKLKSQCPDTNDRVYSTDVAFHSPLSNECRKPTSSLPTLENSTSYNHLSASSIPSVYTSSRSSWHSLKTNKINGEDNNFDSFKIGDSASSLNYCDTNLEKDSESDNCLHLCPNYNNNDIKSKEHSIHRLPSNSISLNRHSSSLHKNILQGNLSWLGQHPSASVSCLLSLVYSLFSSISLFLLVITLLLSNSSSVSASPSPSSVYQPPNKYGPYGLWERSLVLDDMGYFVVEWTASSTDIQFRLTARTRGYIGFGLSSQAKMHDADIVVGWVHSGKAYLQDRHGLGNLEPAVDRYQDWTIVSGYENDTHTVLHVSRPLNTCDMENDYVVSNDTARMLWAYHPDDPVDPDSPRPRLHYHGDFRRGAKSVFLLDRDPDSLRMSAAASSSSSTSGGGVNQGGSYSRTRTDRYSQSSDRPPTHTWTLTSPGVEVHSDNQTIYHCKLFRKPLLVQKNHIIKFEPVFSAGNERHVHHMTVFECHSDKPSLMQSMEELADTSGGMCHSDEMRPLLLTCSHVVVAWAVGSQGLTLPPEAGYPLAPNGAAIFMMQIHYDNPDQRHFQDYSGIRVHYTHVLRNHDAGVLSVGLDPSWKHLIPPRQPSVLSSGHCIGECTQEVIPPSGIQVFGAVTQTHLLGREIKIRHLRRGVELDPIAQDKNYDYNYLEYRLLKSPKIILPGDHLVSECRYNSLDRLAITLGGVNTRDEMCLSYLFYWPKIQLSACHSKPSLNTVLQSLGIQELSHDSDIIKIMKPAELAGKTLEWRLVNYDWQNQFEYFQTTTHTGTFNPMCRFIGHSITPRLEDVDFEYPNISEPWIAEDTCRRPQWSHSKDSSTHRRRQRPHHKRQPHRSGEGGGGLEDATVSSSSGGDESGHLPSADGGGSYNGDVMFDDQINTKPIKRIDADPVRKYDVYMPVIEDFLEPKNHGVSRSSSQDGNFQVSESSSSSRNSGGGTFRGTSGKTINTRKGSPYETLREEFDAMERDLEREVNHHGRSSSSSLDGYWERTAHKTRMNSAPRIEALDLTTVLLVVLVVQWFRNVITRTW